MLALASFLIPNRVSAADNWIEVRSPHFTVDTNAGEKEARKIADQFEQIRHAADITRVSRTWADGTTGPSMDTCSQWKGRHVKVWFTPTPGKDYAGEITDLFFF